MVKLIAMDLDGTLISSGNMVKEKDAQAVIKAHEAGAEIVIATGRNYVELPECVTDLPVRFFITANGSEVYDRDEDKIISLECLSYEDACEVMERGRKNNNYAMYYVGRKVYCTTNFKQYTDKLPADFSWSILEKGFIRCDYLEEFSDEDKQKIMKIVLLFDSEELRDAQRYMFDDLKETIEICASCPDNMEFNPKGVSKGKAIGKIMDILKLEPSDIATMGDGENDIPMLELTPNSFAPAGCTEGVRKTANSILCDAAECAVSEMISILLNS